MPISDMNAGPGKYDPEAEHVFKETGARLAAVLVLGGKNGSGFSVSSGDIKLVAFLPDMLRTMADSIDDDLRKLGGRA